MELLIKIFAISFGWTAALIILIPIVIFIVCWYIWVFSPNQDARKKAAEFSNKTQIVQHKLAEIWFGV
tara:strand:+ start:78 stop:281 length:204 start_codon:yes stop_codon:yes gene_type:complete